AFDLPSRTELREAMSRLEAVSRRLDELGPDAASGPVLGGASRGADSIEDERRKLKKLRKELKRELKTARSSKKKRKKTKTTINVGSPKAMKDRARSKSKKG
ncbi:MAG: hypothetical protein KJO07_21535, partial [Deltaproteobacteria bacterium]|nr:hypothetical protein [Deltaproteobacteria bacterium]